MTDGRTGGAVAAAREASPAPSRGAEPRVEAGAIIVLRMYDVAYAIDLARLEALLAAGPPGAVARIRLARAEPKAMAFGVPPVEIGLGQVALPADEGPITAEATARLYDFGAVSIALRVPASGLGWAAFTDLALAVDDAATAPAAAELWTTLLERVRQLAMPAFERPSAGGVGRPLVAGLEEDYLLAVVQRFDRPLSAEQALRELDLVPLLSGERRELSPAARADLVRKNFSYYTNDLVVLTWDRAFLLEPTGDRDVADVLEVANAQLLELRYYDELLDEELPRTYARVAEARTARFAFSLRRYRYLARDIQTLVAEVTEITERIDNALKVTEDIYLARIYAAALELFRVPSWVTAVDRKLAILKDTYTTLYDEAATLRAEALEAAIVLLIVLEIVLAFVL